MKRLILILFVVSVSVCQASTRQYYSFNNIGGLTQKLCVRGIAQSDDGMIWLATETGLYSFDGYHLVNRPYQYKSVHPGSFNCLFFDNDSLLIGCDRGVLSFNLKTYKYNKLPFAGEEFIKDIVRADSSLWVATRDALYKNGTKLELSYNNIVSLYSDNDFLFIGTANALHRYSVKTNQSEKVIDGIPFPGSYFYDKSEDHLWIGGASKASVWKKKEMEHVFSLPMPVAKTLCKDLSGNMLIGTDNGLYVVSQNRQVTSVMHDARRENSLAGDAVWSIFMDRNKNIWLGTNSGISLVEGGGLMETFSLPSITGEGLGNQFFCTFTDNRGRYWLGGANGLLCIERPGKADQTYRWYKMNDEKYPLAHNRVRDILQDSKGNIIIGGDMGFLIYDEGTQRFRRYYIDEDPYNWVYDIRETANGVFVITTFTSSYIATLDSASFKVVVNKTMQREDLSIGLNKTRDLLEKYGLAENYLSAYYDSVSGTLLLGGTDRFSILDTKKLSSIAKDRSLAITDIRINGQRYADRNSILQGRVVLKPGDKIVELMYSDFRFSGELSDKVLYRIDDGDWMPVHSENNTLLLTNLNPGRYNINICFSDNLNKAISFELKVRAPWYASVLAKIIYLLIFAGLIYGVILIIEQRKRILKERSEHQEFLLKVKQKEKELLSDNEYLAAQLRMRLQARAGEDGVLSDDEKFLLKITKMIEDNMSDSELNVNTLSEISGISSKQLYRKIKAMTGMTTVAYIRDQRLKKAASLLAKGTFTVSEVMYMVGFSNPSYFTRCFTDEYKIPPSEYKK